MADEDLLSKKDRYGIVILRALERVREVGMDTNQLITEALEQIPEEGHTSGTESGWGMRAALNRLFRRGKIAKRFEFQPSTYKRGDGAVVQNAYGKRVYRYYLPQFRPKLEDVQFREAQATTAETAPSEKGPGVVEEPTFTPEE